MGGSIVFGDVIQVRNVAGNVAITLARPLYRVEDLPPARTGATAGQMRSRPSELLQARYEVVPFAGRTTLLLEELPHWLGEPDTPMSVRLVYGPGGQGKSRLAAQFARHHAAGWSVAQAKSASATRGPGRIRVSVGSEGLLVLVDYADRWTLPHLQTLLADLQALVGATSEVPEVRVLLLARAPGFWWDALQGFLDAEFRIPSAAVMLDPLGREIAREELFAAARDRFAEILELNGCEDIGFPGQIGGPRSRQVLTIHMAALAAVDARLHGVATPTGPERISAYLLRRERRFWKEWNARADDKLVTPPETMGRAVFVATLTGPLPYAEGLTVLARADLAAAPEAASQIISDHRRCYPPESPETVLEPLYPDRLGEDFIAITAPGWIASPGADETGAGVQGNDWADVVDPWAGAAIAKLLEPAASAQAQTRWAAAAVTTLVEAASRWPHIASGYLYPLLRAHPRLALEAGGPVLSALARLDSIDEDLLATIAECFPEGSDVGLDTGMAAVTQRLTDVLLDQVRDPAERAQIHAKLGGRLANAGLLPQALQSANEAVSMLRPLLEAGQTEHKLTLAAVLSDLSAVRLSMGQREEALAASEEAVSLLRGLTTATAGGRDPLPAALTNLGLALSNLGQPEQALRTTEEAVSMLRQLAAADQARYEPQLARSLGNLGGMLSFLGQRQAALAPTRESLDIFRRLADANPAAFEPSLATILSNLGIRMLQLGRREEALAPTQEAVRITRRLAQASPAVFERDLARSLTNLGNTLSGLGRRHEALDATGEAASVLQRLAAAQPEAFRPTLALVLNNLCSDLLDAGRLDEALAAVRQAVQIDRLLAAAQPVAFEPELAGSLTNLGNVLSALRQSQEALAATEESVELYRRLAAVNPLRFESYLAASLDHLGSDLSAAGRAEEALPAVREAVELYERLAAAEPTAFEPELAKALSNLGGQLFGLRRLEDCLVAITRAVDLVRRLAAGNPAAFQADLAMYLSNLGELLSELGRPDEALLATREAVELWRPLAAAERGFEPLFASALANFGRVRAAARSELPQALDALHESVAIYRQLTQPWLKQQPPSPFADELRGTGETLADLLEDAGRSEEATAIRLEIADSGA